MKSPGPVPHDQAPETENLIHNPLAALRDAGIIGGDDTPTVSTMVVNHQKTLERFIMHATVVVSSDRSSVGITVVKEERKADEE